MNATFSPALLSEPMPSESGDTCEIPLELVGRFRELKHDINNSVGVMMALCELAERDPVHFQKLTTVIMERCPKIVAELQNFGSDLQKHHLR